MGVGSICRSAGELHKNLQLKISENGLREGVKRYLSVEEEVNLPDFSLHVTSHLVSVKLGSS